MTRTGIDINGGSEALKVVPNGKSRSACGVYVNGELAFGTDTDSILVTATGGIEFSATLYAMPYKLYSHSGKLYLTYSGYADVTVNVKWDGSWHSQTKAVGAAILEDGTGMGDPRMGSFRLSDSTTFTNSSDGVTIETLYVLDDEEYCSNPTAETAEQRYFLGPRLIIPIRTYSASGESEGYMDIGCYANALAGPLYPGTPKSVASQIVSYFVNSTYQLARPMTGTYTFKDRLITALVAEQDER